MEWLALLLLAVIFDFLMVLGGCGGTLAWALVSAIGARLGALHSALASALPAAAGAPLLLVLFRFTLG